VRETKNDEPRMLSACGARGALCGGGSRAGSGRYGRLDGGGEEIAPSGRFAYGTQS